MTDLRRFSDPQSAASAAGEEILSILRSAQAERGRAALAISGGPSPKPMFVHMAEATAFDWSTVHFFWVDERAVPPNHEQSNYRLANELLITPARIPAANIHRIQAEHGASEAAARYRHDIVQFFSLREGQLPQFDCIHLGVGADAHTASLFPGEPLIDDRKRITDAVHVAKLNQDRITLLPGVLLNAQHLIILATGEDKVPALQQILEGEHDPKQYPAQLLRGHASAIWFV